MMRKPKHTTSKLLDALGFPKAGEILQGVKVLSSKANYENDVLTYEIVLPKGTKTRLVPKILRNFFSTQVVPTEDNLVVKHHDYNVSPKDGNVCVRGSMHIAPVVRMNPSMQEFDEEYSSMEMTNPETYFKKHPYQGFNSPQFRAKLFSMVSYMGENYGYCDDKCIYHRRASLIMPKIKITKAVPSAKMMYHTHPKKDEPSLSSADDYLIYMDLSHEPRSIRNFCTVMEDRMDHFEIKPKKGSKQNFLKLDEDKIIEEIDAKISDLEKKWDAKMPKEDATKDDNLRYCENITRDLVKWMNTKYGKYFSFKYKCHYRVKKNPPEPTADDLHLKDEFLQKAVGDVRTRTYSWPEFDTDKMPHENYAYWHQAYYNQHVKDTFMSIGVIPKGSQDRRYKQYMSKKFENTTFTNLDALNLLNLAYDISAQDAKIRDGNGFSSRMSDLCDYMELSDEACETLTLLEQVIHQEDIFSEQAQTLCGDYYALALLSYYSISAVHTIEKVKKGELDPDLAKYEVYSKLKNEVGGALNSFLLSHESLFERGFVDSYLNPPQMTLKRTDYLVQFPPEALELYDLVEEALEQFSKTRYDPKRPFFTAKNKFNLWVPTQGGKVGIMISQSTGTAEIAATTDNPMEDAMEAVDKVGQALYRVGLPVKPEEFGLKFDEGAMNPQRGQPILLAGPSGSGKSTTLRNLAKMLPRTTIAPTITTRRKRKSDKNEEIEFVSKGEFLHMVSQGELVAVQLQKSGEYYGKRASDFDKEGYTVTVVSLSGLNDLKKILPNAYTVYLEPVEDPETIRKRLLRRGDMSAKEAKGRAAIIPSHIASSKKMNFDLRIPMKQGEFDVAAKKIIEMVPKKNPSGPDAHDIGVTAEEEAKMSQKVSNQKELLRIEAKKAKQSTLFPPLPPATKDNRWWLKLTWTTNDKGDLVAHKKIDKKTDIWVVMKPNYSPDMQGLIAQQGAIEFICKSKQGSKVAEEECKLWIGSNLPMVKGRAQFEWRSNKEERNEMDGIYAVEFWDMSLDEKQFAEQRLKYTQSTLPPELTAGATVSPLSAEEWNTAAGKRQLNAIRDEREEAYAAAVKEREAGYRQATIEEILPQSIVWDYTKRGTGLDMTDEYEIVAIPVEELEKAFQKSPMYVPPNSGGKVEGVAVAAYQGTPLPVLQGGFAGEAFEFTDGRHRFAYTRDKTNDTTVPVAVYAVKENPAKDLFDWFEEWAKLINMKNKELKAFLDSDWGKVAGLSKEEAKDWNNIKSGRVSARRIMSMRKKIGLGGPKDYIKDGPRIIESYYEKALNNWTGPSDDPMRGETDWDWCKRQVRFNKRAGAFPYNPSVEKRKGPLVKKMKTYARPSRRLLSLWVWGHDPWRWARKNGFERMSPCPNVPWIGMTEKNKWGKIEVEMSPRKKNPGHDPIEAEARRAASDPSFVHHEWYIEHHLDYVMAIAKSIVNSDEPEDQQLIHDMVWMHDYPKMMGDKENFELVRELVSQHRSERYTERLMNQLRWMEEIKSPDWSGGTTTIAAVMSTADALAHYYGPFWQIYMDENQDKDLDYLKQSNAAKLEKDKRKLRAGPMKGALDSVKLQYKDRQVRVVGNDHIAKLIERSNPRTPGGKKFPTKYLSGLTSEEKAIAIKEIDAGYKYDINDPKAYEYWKSDIKATARGYETVPSKYRKKFIQMYGPLPEKGDFITKMSKATGIKKSILQKVYDKGLAAWRVGHRPGVQQHQWATGRVYSFVTLGNTVKKGNKKMPDHSLAVEAGLVKDNPPLFVHPDKAEKWSERYEKVTNMTGQELIDLANKMAEEKGLRIEVNTVEADFSIMTTKRKDFALPPKYEKLYKEWIESRLGVNILLYRGSKIIDKLEFSVIYNKPTELLKYIENRKRWGTKRRSLPHFAKVVKGRNGKPRVIINSSVILAVEQNNKRFPYAYQGAGGYEMTESQKGKGYYGIIKTMQAGLLESANLEHFGQGETPMRSDLYQSYGWLTAYSYKENAHYGSRAAEYFLNLHGITKRPNKDADYWWVYRPVYSRKNPSEADFFPGDTHSFSPYATAQTIPITALQNPNARYALRSIKEVMSNPSNNIAPGSRLFNRPLPEALEIAKQYMESIGQPYRTTIPITQVNKSFMRGLAMTYEGIPDSYDDPEVIEAYEALIEETEAQFLAIRAAGYVVEIDNDDPYSSSYHMIEDLRNNKRLKIFSTESGFGNEPITEDQRRKNLLLRQTEHTDINGQPLLANDLFRFVHDFFGHAVKGNGFGPIGEENAWSSHSMMYGPIAVKAMTTEARGQFVWTFYSGANKEVAKVRQLAKQLRAEGKMEEAAKISQEVYEKILFAEQKMILLPDKFIVNNYPLANPSEWRHGEFAEEDPFEEYF